MAAQASIECTVLVAHKAAADAHDALALTFVSVGSKSFSCDASPLTVTVRHTTHIRCNVARGEQGALKLDLHQPSEIDSLVTLATKLCFQPATAYASNGCSHMHSKRIILPCARIATDLLQP
jgi:hypothetical protein